MSRTQELVESYLQEEVRGIDVMAGRMESSLKTLRKLLRTMERLERKIESTKGPSIASRRDQVELQSLQSRAYKLAHGIAQDSQTLMRQVGSG